MSIIINEHSSDSDNLFGLPYILIQLILSIITPIFIYYLGMKGAIKGLKKKELARLITLKEYYYLWVKDILKDAVIQNGYYREYCIGLYKLDSLGGVPFKMIDLTFEKLNSIDDKDIYKIFMELNSVDSTMNADKLIKISKKLLFIDSTSKLIKDEHKEFTEYLIELREIWNKQIGELHSLKYNINKAWTSHEISKEFFAAINIEFIKWSNIPGDTGLKETYTFLKQVETIVRNQYSLTPENNLVSDMIFSVQGLQSTYMMFHVYRLERFKKFKYYHNELAKTISDLNTLIESVQTTPNITWKKIKSYQ